MMRSIACLLLLALSLLQGCTIVAAGADLSVAHPVAAISDVAVDEEGFLVARVTYGCGESEEICPPLHGAPPVTLLGPLKRLPPSTSVRGAGTHVAVLAGKPELYELVRLESGTRTWHRISLAKEATHYTAGRIAAKVALVTFAFAADVAFIALLSCAMLQGGVNFSPAAQGLAGGIAGGAVGATVGHRADLPPPLWIVRNRSGHPVRVSLYGAQRYHQEIAPGSSAMIQVAPGRYTSKVEVPGRAPRRERVSLKHGDEYETDAR